MIEEVAPNVVVIGTAHVSAKSVEQVESTIRERRPTKVLVELDAKRYDALRDPEAWKKTDIIQILRERRQHVFLLQLYLANMQARMGEETGVPPGGELLRAVQVAEEVGAEVVLIDRDVTVTLKRGFGSMNLWQRLRLFWNVWAEVLTPGNDGDEPSIDDLLETDAVTAMTEEFAKFAPAIKTSLIDERDEYMASHIRDHADGTSVVAVVGAGHMAGIKRHYAAETADRRAELDVVPRKPVTFGRIVGIGIPAVILGIWARLLVDGDYTEFRDNLVFWILINGTLSAIGAFLARGHILSVLTAFIAAPLTSLSPAMAAGWFAGLMEAKVHTPTVGDFEEIKRLESWKDFWKNGVVRILLVAALANLGSVAGSWLGLIEVAKAAAGAP